jgi:hypothetical protein
MFLHHSTSFKTATELYAFTSFQFTNCGRTGILGPIVTDCTTAYAGNSWVTNTNYFNVITQGFQLWTVPKSGSYLIDCIGACGGGASAGLNYGAGARMQEVVTLVQGSKLQIIVGQMGGVGSGGCGGQTGGGGGGSFVVRETASYANLFNNWANINQYVVVVAGGGGGIALNRLSVGQGNATLSVNAKNGDGSVSLAGLGGVGSALGAGGQGTNNCVNGAYGGGSLINDGGIVGSTLGGQGIFRSSGTSMGSGGNGNGFPNGGFGGGGAANQYMGGGGGGLSGGGGGGITNCACANLYGGGGGGSFSMNRSSSPWYGSSLENYNFTTHGSVTITKV